ncbi:DHH family phosphoesterase [Bacillus infantis]|jgi:uncharacterized protein|uniref:DHH family phosphoesterase n=1 Tax=Bacillus infantis TaxID=324767 RepID=UPI0021559F52|nr:oligoribonuclease [Bacillus infantis]MCR6610935.1 oligoribonuclease [Bacillus infantis]
MYRLFTHNDLDGIGCGILAKLAYGDKAEVRYNSVSGLDIQISRHLDRLKNKEKKQDTLLITDLSVNEENEQRLTQLQKEGGTVQLIDHHKSALHLNSSSWASVTVEYDDGRLASATSLFFDYLIKENHITPTEALKEFVELVRQYDTWEWDQNGNMKAKQLNDLFFLLSIDEFEEKMLDRLKDSTSFEFDEFEKKLLEMEEDKIERYMRRKKREIVQAFIGEHCAGIVHAESYHSELGNELGKEFPHLDYIALLSIGGKRISYRTIHDHIDVSEIAGRFGGGGHAKASGSSMTEEAFSLFVKDVFSDDPIKGDAFKNEHNHKDSETGSLYENRKGDHFLIFKDNHAWRIDVNGRTAGEEYDSFTAAEHELKRSHSAWLARDEVYIEYLKDFFLEAKLNSSKGNRH